MTFIIENIDVFDCAAGLASDANATQACFEKKHQQNQRSKSSKRCNPYGGRSLFAWTSRRVGKGRSGGIVQKNFAEHRLQGRQAILSVGKLMEVRKWRA